MRRAAIALVGAVLASGCMVVRVALVVDPDGMVDGTASVAYRIVFLEDSTLSPADGQRAILNDLTDDGVDGLACSASRDAQTIGADCTLTDVPVAELSQLDVFDRHVAIARVENRMVVDSVIDLTEFEPNPSNDLDAVVRITFAGPVIEQTGGGAVQGTAVSWAPRLGERLEAHAAAEATPRDQPTGVPLPIVAMLAVVVAALVGAGVFLLARRR